MFHHCYLQTPNIVPKAPLSASLRPRRSADHQPVEARPFHTLVQKLNSKKWRTVQTQKVTMRMVRPNLVASGTTNL